MSVKFNNSNNENHGACPICWGTLKDGLVSHETSEKVQHVFHNQCLTNWVETCATCPLCTAKVSSVNGVAISDPLLGKAVIQAVEQGSTQRVRALLQKGPISASDYTAALTRAISLSLVDIALALLEKDTLTEGNRGFMVKTAADRPDSEKIIDKLLRNGPISTKERGIAVKNAAGKRASYGKVRALLNSGPIPVEHRRAAINLAVDKGQVETVQLLVENSSLSEIERQRAIHDARANLPASPRNYCNAIAAGTTLFLATAGTYLTYSL